MKKTIISIVAAFVAITISAQTVNVHFKNGQTIQFPSGNVDYVDFSAKAPDPTVSAGAVVDLGLSVYWCSCNLGADAPEGYGDFYAWGETKVKSTFTETNYSFYDVDKKQYIEIGDDITGTEYDAATINLGNGWRMPTHNEIKELVTDCTWEWTQINGINGYKVTGPSGNSIFLPAAGYGHGGSKGKSLAYYSSTQYSPGFAYHLSATSENIWHDLTSQKYSGNNIRPVKNK